MKKRLVSAVVGLSLAIGVVGLPAEVASATPLGKLTVQLVDVKGKALHLKNVQLALTNKGAETDWTTNSKGLADFHSVAASTKYVISTVGLKKYVPAKRTGIVVKAGKTTHATLKVILGASISGSVENSEGQHPVGITVQVLNEKTQTIAASVLTSATGGYTAGGLPTGKYTVYFNYASALADQFPRLGTLSQGTVSVTAQTTKHGPVSKKNYDASLTTLIRLSGTTTQTGVTSITAHQAATGSTFLSYDFRPPTNGSTRSFELYLPAGSYTISADNSDSNSHIWYVSDGSPTSFSQSDAATITLSDDDRAIVVNPHA